MKIEGIFFKYKISKFEAVHNEPLIYIRPRRDLPYHSAATMSVVGNAFSSRIANVVVVVA